MREQEQEQKQEEKKENNTAQPWMKGKQEQQKDQDQGDDSGSEAQTCQTTPPSLSFSLTGSSSLLDSSSLLASCFSISLPSFVSLSLSFHSIPEMSLAESQECSLSCNSSSLRKFPVLDDLALALLTSWLATFLSGELPLVTGRMPVTFSTMLDKSSITLTTSLRAFQSQSRWLKITLSSILRMEVLCKY